MIVHMLKSALQAALEAGRQDTAKGLEMLKNLQIRIKRAGCQLNVEQGQHVQGCAWRGFTRTFRSDNACTRKALQWCQSA